ncbi:hypothetical protein P3G55_20385 [Leptospira sp. 96542]|nr:hypothetical protein [Leptospira sp. 96542]
MLDCSGAWAGIPYTEDYCSDLIEFDDKHAVVKHPISINAHFAHLSSQKERGYFEYYVETK